MRLEGKVALVTGATYGIGTTILERPAPNPNHVTVRIDYVREVDAHGRPVYPEGRVVSEYNPLDRL